MSNEVNRIGWANTAIGNGLFANNSKTKPEAEAEKQSTAFNQNLNSTVSPEDVLSAMQNLGAYNFINVNKTEAQTIDPTKYLSEERIAEIEAMMAEFDSGVEEVAAIIGKELPEDVSQATKNALAASIYAQE